MTRRSYPSAGLFRSLSATLLLLVLPCNLVHLPCAAQDASTMDDQLGQIASAAKTAQQQGDYKTAAARYEEIVKLRPDLAEAWVNLGLMHQFSGEYTQAEHDFQVALKNGPQLYVPNLFLGIDLLREHKPDAALHYLKLAQQMNPRDEQAALSLAQAEQALHDDRDAVSWYLRATELNPKDADAWYGLGVSYLAIQHAAVVRLVQLNADEVHTRTLVADAFVEQGRTTDAIGIYTRFRDAPGRPPCLLSGLGFAYAEQGSGPLAQDTLQQELGQEPGCLTARLGFARIAITKSDFAAALSELRAAWQADENFIRAHSSRVWQGLAPEQIDPFDSWLRQSSSEADQGLVQVLAESIESGGLDIAVTGQSKIQGEVKGNEDQSTPEKLWAGGHYTACATKLGRARSPLALAPTLLLAQCSFYSGGYRSSLAASDAALQIDRKSPAALYWKAKSAQQLAANALKQMSSAASESPRVHLLLAELHRAREEYGPAEAEYKLAIESMPGDASAHLGLAHVYHENSQDDKALEQLQNVLHVDPGNAEAGLLMGEILVRNHQYVEAEPYLTAALAGPPEGLAQAHALLARCDSAQGRYAQALAQLKPALASDTMGTYHYQLYQIYEKLGDHQAATTALQESQKLRRQESESEVSHRGMDGAGAKP
jgi:tetratricopeptide (TPR) repeat protein